MFISRFLIDQNVINNELKVLNNILQQQRQLKKTLILYLEKISDCIYSTKESQDLNLLISYINTIKQSFENIKSNINEIIELKNYLENITKFDYLETSYFEKYNNKYLNLFEKISNDNIYYYSFMETILKHVKIEFPENSPSISEINYDLNNNTESIVYKKISEYSSQNQNYTNLEPSDNSNNEETYFFDSTDEILENDNTSSIIEKLDNIEISNNSNTEETYFSDSTDEVLEDDISASILEELDNIEVSNNSNTEEIYFSDSTDEILENDNTSSIIEKLDNIEVSNNSNTEEIYFSDSTDEVLEDDISASILEELDNIEISNTEETYFSDFTDEILENDNTSTIIQELNNMEENTNNDFSFNINMNKILDTIPTSIITENNTESEKSLFEEMYGQTEKKFAPKKVIDPFENMANTLSKSNFKKEINIAKQEPQKHTPINSIQKVQHKQKIKEHKTDFANTDNFLEKTLIISEKDNLAILPYSITELEEYFSNNPQKYSSLQDIIDKEYTISLEDYKNAPIARFKEAFNLARHKENLSFMESINLANELLFNTNLNPAVITACKNLDELDIYLSCLEDDALEDFKFFKIKYI